MEEMKMSKEQNGRKENVEKGNIEKKMSQNMYFKSIATIGCHHMNTMPPVCSDYNPFIRKK